MNQYCNRCGSDLGSDCPCYTLHPDDRAVIKGMRKRLKKKQPTLQGYKTRIRLFQQEINRLKNENEKLKADIATKITPANLEGLVAELKAARIKKLPLHPYIPEISESLNEAKQIHPEYPKDPVHMVAIMVEEAGEAMQEANDILWGNGSVDDLRTELLHTIATAIRCLEQIDEEER